MGHSNVWRISDMPGEQLTTGLKTLNPPTLLLILRFFIQDSPIESKSGARDRSHVPYYRFFFFYRRCGPGGSAGALHTIQRPLSRRRRFYRKRFTVTIPSNSGFYASTRSIYIIFFMYLLEISHKTGGKKPPETKLVTVSTHSAEFTWGPILTLLPISPHPSLTDLEKNI